VVLIVIHSQDEVVEKCVTKVFILSYSASGFLITVLFNVDSIMSNFMKIINMGRMILYFV